MATSDAASTTASASRERILGRIRAALERPAGLEKHATEGPPIFAPVTDAMARLTTECAGNMTELIRTSNAEGTSAALGQVLASLPEGEIYSQDAPRLRSALKTTRPVRWSSQGPPPETSQATISLCHTLVAQTGSILVTASDGGRGASVVAPCHIVVASRDQLVPDLETALAGVVASGAPQNNSFLCLITGSSRTADIEKILVLGAHGPRRLVLIVEG